MSQPHDPAGRPDPWAHRRGEPRTFAATWIVFLFIVAVVALGLGGALGLVGTDAYRVAARLMLSISGVGLGLLWPALRLSQDRPEHPRRAMAIDGVIVGVSIQAMIVPQKLPWMGAWAWAPLLLVGAGLALWAGVIAGVLAAWATRHGVLGAAGRAGTMLGVTLLVLAGPGVVLAWGVGPGDPAEPAWAQVALTLSPVTLAGEVLAPRQWSGQAAMATPGHVVGVVLTGVLAGVAWWLASGRVVRDGVGA